VVAVANDKDREAAKDAVVAFGEDTLPVLPDLLAMLADKSHPYRGQVADMICAIGLAAKVIVPDMIKLLDAKDPFDPSRVIRILCAIGPDAEPAIPAIDRAVKRYLDAEKRNEELSYYLILDHYQYHKLGAKMVPTLITLLKVENSAIMYQAAKELSKLGPAAKAALPALKEAQKHLNDIQTEIARQPLLRPAPAAPATLSVPGTRPYNPILEAIDKIEAKPKK
jgi:HEAT repeat protein